ncbi:MULTISPECIES: DUF2946 family protein [Falsihalocynthiibacter]|uniref:DUF2946 family protein n=1 Tax=Falsihalocynthiibacter TaxID=2854182 RepID=UPI003002C6D6
MISFKSLTFLVGLFAFHLRAVLSLCLPQWEAYSWRMFIPRSKSTSMLAAVLALVMVLTSMATAMGQMRGAAVGEMVLCTGYGPRVVQIDAQGQPVEARTTCPDCLLSAVILEAPASTFTTDMVFTSADLRRVSVAFPTRPARSKAHSPRAPPLA